MINAEEARQMTHEFHDNQIKAQLDKIENVIIKAAKTGTYYCQIKGWIYEEVAEHLKELGYTIRKDTVCNEIWNCIGWEWIINA